LKFARFDPEPCGFPKPRVPLLPDRAKFVPAAKNRAVALRSNQSRHFRDFTRGRYALGEAYRLAGGGNEGALLAPAYHCVTMLDPAIALGADIAFYPLHGDLSPDAAQLDALLFACGKPVKALLAVHFFGIVQNFGWLKAWCERHEITLIEDCSHVLFTGNFQADGTGIFGKFITASPYKFFPCADGGLLYSPEHGLLDEIRTTPATLTEEFRGIRHLLGITSRGKLPSVTDEAVAAQFEAARAHSIVGGISRIVERSQPSAQYSAAATKKSALRSSRLIVSHSSVAGNIRRRRNNYRRWAQAVAGLPNCRALFPELPAGCIPYMFALHIEHPNPHFYWLKQLAMPIWRWDEMAVSDCPVAGDYRLHLLHLPCHQALTDAHMDWMTDALRQTLLHAARGDA
jgi:dTDP-4-amino-4,6-dideoxygalactose transaminase